MSLSKRNPVSRLLFPALLALLALGLAAPIGGAEARVIYACAQKHGNTTHRAKAAIRLVPKGATCLPSERHLSWLTGPGQPLSLIHI